jgi:hypothetical protein
VFVHVAVAITAMAVVAACGSGRAGVSSAVPPVTTSSPVVSSVPQGTTPTGGVSVTVTASDNGRVYSVKTGQVVAVSLSSGEQWTDPIPSDPAVLHRIDGAVDRVTGNATAMFSAATDGSTLIKSSHRCLPAPGRTCPMYVALWSVTISVSS